MSAGGEVLLRLDTFSFLSLKMIVRTFKKCCILRRDIDSFPMNAP